MLLFINWSVTETIVTTLALCFTIFFSWQNRKMMKDRDKARLIFAVKQVGGVYFLEVKNIGYYTAKGIKLSFKNDFLTVIGSGLVESSKNTLKL